MLSRREHKPIVLVLERSQLVRKLLTVLLEREGAEVICVENSDEALNVLRLYRPNLILAELKAAQAGNFNLITSIRNDPALAIVPIVVMAATTEEERCKKALALGANGYLPKPFTIQSVTQMFELYCNVSEDHSQPSAAIALGILCYCDLQRNLFKQVLSKHGYNILVNCRPDQLSQVSHFKVNAVRLWLLDPLDQEDMDSWSHLEDQIGGSILFGMGRPPMDKNGHSSVAFQQWERRLLNKIQISLFGRVMHRAHESVFSTFE